MRSWHELACLEEEDLRVVDLVECNLAAAANLPGAWKMNPVQCLNRVDELTQSVRSETEKYMPQYYRQPSKFNHSEAAFRMNVMATILQRDRGINYNPAKRSPDSPFFEEDSFVFGILQGDGGTCASLPVLYASIGRRLGYPLKLVSTWTHLFLRWEDERGERFNVEVTNKGAVVHPDQYYREGVYSDTIPFEKDAGLLQSLTPRRELAAFLNIRAQYWWARGFHRNAVHCQAWQAELDGYPKSQVGLEFRVKQWECEIRERSPIRLPRVEIEMLPRRFSLISRDLEAKIVCIGILDDFLAEHYRKRPQSLVPARLAIPKLITVKMTGACPFLDHHDPQ